MIGIGIVGTGVIANIHSDAIKGIPDAELLAVYDSDPQRANEFAYARSVAAYDKVSDFFNHPDISLIAVCTPSGAHLDIAVKGAEAGKHLLIEKPIEVTSARGKTIAASCKKHGVLLGSVFQTRFHPSALLLKKAVKEGWFGRISLATAEVKWFRSQEYYDGSPWRGTWFLDGGGALMNQSIHVIDLLLWLFGKPVSVHASAGLLTHTNIEVEDTLVASLAFFNGPLSVISATTGAWPGSFKTLEICGESGHVRLEEDRLVRWNFSPGSPGNSVNGLTISNSDVSDPVNIGAEAHRAQYLDLIRAINTGGQPMVGAKEAIAAVELVERIYHAAGIGPDEPPDRTIALDN